jgi:hypothetical protein
MSVTPPKKKIGVTAFLTLSAISGVVVGLVVWGGVRDLNASLLWGGATFIVVIMSIATLALMVKDDSTDPDAPKLK